MIFQKLGKDVIHAKFNVKAGKIDLRYAISEKVAKAAIPHDIHIHKKSIAARAYSASNLAWVKQAAQAYLV